ncbi:nickel pincer cofactor biosynthesis protein LarC [Adlercreutzia sp. ZJ141]|uniref:nickel pincer cofactor biosynthesis protein LarC n=1 Tax=Adlercreutzia sp. ZJ141 TaxID=2709406 RepID=UPI0013EBEE7A|nr:nickel pincer cofactor biosynthesis protein LarC [Adlercreutzia sp. ZJ141]
MPFLYLECNAGIAGDMLCSALLDLLPADQATEAIQHMNELPLPGVQVKAERTKTCGITGTQVHVFVHGEEEPYHNHPGAHAHEHHHEHRSYLQVTETIDSFTSLPEAVRRNACAVYRLIAEAEATVHGTTMNDIHFHEVGTLDAIADVTFACLLMDMISPERVIASPVRTGYGSVHCAHGVLPVPAPATALLLESVPNYAGDLEGEFCTPTGAALLKYFATTFAQRPIMSTTAIGYGIGTKRMPIANCVRAFLGETVGAATSDGDIVEACCNVDDMTAEDIAFACEQLMEAGALDAFTIPIGMKKGRPGVLVCALCKPDMLAAIEDALFCHTTTLGVRHRTWKRTALLRDIIEVDTPLGPVRQKIARNTSGAVIRRKWEHDDLARLALEHHVSIEEIRHNIEQ